MCIAGVDYPYPDLQQILFEGASVTMPGIEEALVAHGACDEHQYLVTPPTKTGGSGNRYAIKCKRSGTTRNKKAEKDTSSHKRRNRSSMKCGCGFEVVLEPELCQEDDTGDGGEDKDIEEGTRDTEGIEAKDGKQNGEHKDDKEIKDDEEDKENKEDQGGKESEEVTEDMCKDDDDKKNTEDKEDKDEVGDEQADEKDKKNTRKKAKKPWYISLCFVSSVCVRLCAFTSLWARVCVM